MSAWSGPTMAAATSSQQSHPKDGHSDPANGVQNALDILRSVLSNPADPAMRSQLTSAISILEAERTEQASSDGSDDGKRGKESQLRRASPIPTMNARIMA